MDYELERRLDASVRRAEGPRRNYQAEIDSLRAEIDRLRAGLTAICDADHDSADMRTIAKRVLEGLEP